MVSQTIRRSKRRLLLNAEAFGFGPAAAIADFFPYLRERFDLIGYAGCGHTLDLQRKLPYDALHDLTGCADEALDGKLKEIFAGYDLMLTALDFALATKAKAFNLPVCIYDPLTWYWSQIDPIVARCDLYIAQDFFGVKERIANDPEKFPTAQVVSPIVPDFMPWRGKREHVLLNLGGLTNPYWKQEDTLAYARLVVSSFCKSIYARNESVVIAANAFLAKELREFGVRNYTREQMQNLLHKAKYAFMTPGLGNIYDAARYCTPTIWLPPTNDSQGQQLNVLSLRNRSDGALNWQDFLPGSQVDYCAEQQTVLRKIADNVGAAAADPKCATRLTRLISKRFDALRGTVVGAPTGLLIELGWGGASAVADLVYKQAEKESG
ncbi:MAG: hypothetical protein K2W82_10875 [Candidatus Obscuribacterales bacterium]|nr:hypothetical protein [Candidatus Obscuribacterales bacterium]